MIGEDRAPYTVSEESPIQETGFSEEDLDTDTASNTVFESGEEEGTDYEALVKDDMSHLSEELLSGEEINISDLKNPLRYGALRDLGLTPKEAYLATAEPIKHYDNRSHLRSAVPHGAGGGIPQMSMREMEEARNLFCGLSDREIRRLYKKVTK